FLENYVDSTIYGVEVFNASTTPDVDFTLSPIPGNLTGSVFLYGGNGNIDDVLISCGDFTTNPNSSGSYSMNVFPGNYTVNAYLQNYEELSKSREIIMDSTTVCDFIINYLTPSDSIWFEVEENDIINISWNSPIIELPSLPVPNSYKLLRRCNDEEWITIGENIIDTIYSDNLQQEPDGEYIYGIQAEYEFGVSDTTFCSELILDRFKNIIISATLNNNNTPVEIVSNLICNDSIYSQTFIDTTNESGIINLENVYTGEFYSTFKKQAYHTLHDTIQVTETDTVFSIELEEICCPPEIDSLFLIDNYGVKFVWCIPDSCNYTVQSYDILRKFNTDAYELIANEIPDTFYYDSLYNEPDGNYQYGCAAIYTTGESDTIDSESISLHRFEDVQISISLSDGLVPEGVEYNIQGLDSVYSENFSGETMQSGEINLTDVFFADYTINLSKQDYYSLVDTLTVNLDSTNQFSYVLEAMPGTIQGNLILLDGNANVEDVEISVDTFTTTPDTAGNYSITISPGIYNVSTFLQNYADSIVSNVVVTNNDITDSINFALHRIIGCIEGTISVSAGNYNIENTNIIAINADSSYTTNPDSIGFYQIILPGGFYSVTAILENYEDSTITEVEVLDNQTTSDVDFCLNPILGSVQGNVTIANGSGWVEDVEVTAGEITVNPDPFGDYEISLPAGSYDVTAYINPTYYDSTIVGVSVFSNQVTTGIDFSLSSIPGFLEGSVTIELGGTGEVTDVNITVGEIVGHPNSDGNFNFPVVPGTYTVIAGMLGYEIQEIPNTVIEVNDTTHVDFNLQYLQEPADIWLENLSAEYIATIAWTPIAQPVAGKFYRDEPVFQSYTIWRRHYLEIWDEWEIITQNVLDSTYSDNLQQQPDGGYLYGVQAIYDIGASTITRSQQTYFVLNRFQDITINITTNDGVLPSNVSYDLQGLDQIYAQGFFGITDTTGIIDIENVYKTAYSIILNKQGYETLTDTLTVTDSIYQFAYELQEEYIAPSVIETELTDTFSVEINWTGNVPTNRSPLHYKLYRKYDQEEWEILSEQIYENNYLDDLKESPDGDYQYGIQTIYTTGSSDTLLSETMNLFRFVNSSLNITFSDEEPPDSISYNIVGLDSIYQQEFSGMTQNSGVINLTGIFMSDYEVVLTRATYDTLCDTISVSGQGQQFDFTMEALPGKIEGIVNLIDGAGNVQEVEIGLGTFVVNPDTSGFYSITLPAGNYSLTATLPEYTDSTIAEVTVSRGETTTGVDFSLLPIKATPTLYIFQNPYLINYVQFAANVVQSVADSVALKINGQIITLDEIAENSYLGKYHFIQPGEFVITFSAYNSGGDSTIIRFFSVVRTDENGGEGSSVDHKFTVDFPAGSLPENRFIIVSDSSLINPLFENMQGIYCVGINGMDLSEDAEVSFKYNSPDKAIFYYKNDSWTELPTIFDAAGLHAKIDELGYFRIIESDNTTIAVSLSQNYPNPFKTQTEIEFTIRSIGENISLSVYNIKGQLVRKLAEGSFEPGLHLANWNGKNENGINCSPGIYFLMFHSPQKNVIRKMVYLK
ncbi:MAG: T9SS type A sorting domain-containing protein, partial [Candidatus Cloacimonadota bacterium]|nr:T9SS type A sorting domain-containing protein [Candidatus Cloacimonadota bacterium]